MVLVLSISSDSVLYLYPALSKYLIGFQNWDLNSSADARVVANVDGQMEVRPDECTEYRIPISCHA